MRLFSDLLSNSPVLQLQRGRKEGGNVDDFAVGREEPTYSYCAF